MTPSDIPARVLAVRERIQSAAIRSGRDANSVRLLAVSKFQPVAAIRAAYAAGQRDFGENYVQELRDKSALLADLPDIRFHLIGHLQTNKVRHVVDVATRIHSVDSLRLVDELEKRAAQSRPTAVARPLHEPTIPTDLRLRCLVAVNVAGEETKSGAEPGEVPALVERLRSSKHLFLDGLFTVPPAGPAEAARPHFEALRALRDELGGASELPELSMGMSADLEVAIAEGATWVRVGTDIFGARPPREVALGHEPLGEER